MVMAMAGGSERQFAGANHGMAAVKDFIPYK